jgi:uncharacterized membrane protein YgcG
LCPLQSIFAMADGCDILTKKDKSIDKYLFEILENIREELKVEFVDLDDEYSEDYQKRFEELANQRLNGTSIMLGSKLGSVLKNYLDQYYTAQNVSSFGHIRLPRKDLKSFSLDYGECFRAWVTSPYVSYETTNKIMLGQLSLLDCFVLHVWSFLVCYRSRGDNMFALSICGKSSVGKSVIFENVFFENGFHFNGEAGVGRYDAKARSILIYHDINIRILANGKNDADKFKTIARSEKTSAKVHSTVKSVPALFVVITSNMRIHNHHQQREGSFMTLNFHSELTYGTKKAQTAHGESIEAVKNRVLEAYCSARPVIDPKFFPTNGCFRRKNFILGVYGYVLDIVQKYTQTDFYSIAFVAYILTGLTENAAFYCQVMDDGEERMEQLVKIIKTLSSSEKECAAYLKLVPQPKKSSSPSSRHRSSSSSSSSSTSSSSSSSSSSGSSHSSPNVSPAKRSHLESHGQPATHSPK